MPYLSQWQRGKQVESVEKGLPESLYL